MGLLRCFTFVVVNIQDNLGSFGCSAVMSDTVISSLNKSNLNSVYNMIMVMVVYWSLDLSIHTILLHILQL